MKHNMNRVLSIVALLMITIGSWAGEVVIIKNPSNGGTVNASEAVAGQTCTLTVTPADGNYLKSIKALTLVSGNALQAPRRADNIGIDEEEITLTKTAGDDLSQEATYTFMMPSDGNLNVEVTAEFAARTSIENAAITLAATSFTYDGTDKEPAVSSVVLGQTTLNAADYAVSYSSNKNAGTNATVTVTAKNAYMGTATTTFTILAKSITSDMITLTDTSFGYDGETHIPGVTVADGNTSLTAGTDFTISYQVLDGETAVNTEVIIDAATYNVVITGYGNYTGSATKSFTITKAPLTLTVSLEGWTFAGTANTPTISGNLGNGGVTYTYSVNTENPEDQEFTPTVPENAGSYIVKATVAETDNYASGSATAEFTIAKAALPVGGENGLKVSLAGWTYGAQHAGPTVSGNLGNGNVTYTYKVNNENVQEFTETEPTNVGSYIVKATVAVSDNYLGAEAQTTFAIEKANITGLTVSENEELVYDGTVKELVTESNVPEGATVKYYFKQITEDQFKDGSFDMICEPSDNDYTTTLPTSTNAGYFGIVYMVDGGNNYNKIEATATLKVAVYPAEITELTIDNTPLVYTGEPNTVTITSVKAGTINLTANDYTVSYEMVIEDEDPEPVDAPVYTGTYNVIVTGKGNFTGTKSESFSIVNRTLAENEVTFNEGWATYFNGKENVELPSGIGAFVATNVGDGVVTVSQIKYIPEGVPVLLNNATENAGTEEFDVELGVNLLEHAYENTDVSEIYGTVYGLHNGSMMRVTGTIPQGKNYLLVPDEVGMGPQAPQLTIVFEGETTGIDEVRSKMDDVKGDVYDLMGRKVQKPSKKGLYIQKGHKVVINK